MDRRRQSGFGVKPPKKKSSWVQLPNLLSGESSSWSAQSTYYEGDDLNRRRRKRRLTMWLRSPVRRTRMLLCLVFALVIYLTVYQGSFSDSEDNYAVRWGNTLRRTMQPNARTTNEPGSMASVARHKQKERQAHRQHVHEQARVASMKAAQANVVPSRKRVALPDEVMRRHGNEHPISKGLLRVDPSSTIHPIYQLMRDARTQWDAKVARQSKTLREAVDEYQRRHHRPPPAGFDKWWRYVVKNNVQMPDEYDQIERDVKLFRALHPRDVRARTEKAMADDDSFTIKVRNGQIYTSGQINLQDKLHVTRRDGQVGLIRDIAADLPDVTVVYSVHDTPDKLVSYNHRRTLLDAYEDGEYIDADEPIEPERGWGAACAYTSPLRQYDQYEELPPIDDAPEHKSFIANHRMAMDPCAHPKSVRMHGFLAGKNPVSEGLSAKFAISKTTMHSDIVGIPPERVATASEVTVIPWKNKIDNELMWRGTNTGMEYSKKTLWRDSHRLRLIRVAASNEGESIVLTPPGSMNGKTIADTAEIHDHAEANPHYFDMEFFDGPLQCVQDGSCDELALNYPFGPWVSQSVVDSHKYVFDVDGNAWSARFQRLLMSASLVFKTTMMPEWYNDRIQPWVHYVPISLDYSDIRDALAFFAGDLDGQGGRDDLAEDIGKEGREWASTYYRSEDMTAYVFRLYLEWARLQAPVRDRMNFKYDPSMEIERE